MRRCFVLTLLFSFSSAIAPSLVDLPGTYSLARQFTEEVIAREFILREQPDAVIAVVNASNLDAACISLPSWLPLPSPLIVALNMMDVAAQEGLYIEPQVLEAALGVPVIPMTATRSTGTRGLLQLFRTLSTDSIHHAALA